MLKQISFKKIVLFIILLVLGLQNVFAASGVAILEGPLSQFFQMMRNQNIVYGTTVFFFFLLLYGIYASALKFVQVFKQDSGLSKQGKIVGVSLSVLSTLSIFYFAKGTINEILQTVLNPFGIFAGLALALLFAGITYFGIRGNDKESETFAWTAAAAGFGMVLAGMITTKDSIISWGFLILIIAMIAGLIFGRKPREAEKFSPTPTYATKKPEQTTTPKKEETPATKETVKPEEKKPDKPSEEIKEEKEAIKKVDDQIQKFKDSLLEKIKGYKTLEKEPDNLIKFVQAVYEDFNKINENAVFAIKQVEKELKDLIPLVSNAVDILRDEHVFGNEELNDHPELLNLKPEAEELKTELDELNKMNTFENFSKVKELFETFYKKFIKFCVNTQLAQKKIKKEMDELDQEREEAEKAEDEKEAAEKAEKKRLEDEAEEQEKAEKERIKIEKAEEKKAAEETKKIEKDVKDELKHIDDFKKKLQVRIHGYHTINKENPESILDFLASVYKDFLETDEKNITQVSHVEKELNELIDLLKDALETLKTKHGFNNETYEKLFKERNVIDFTIINSIINTLNKSLEHMKKENKHVHFSKIKTDFMNFYAQFIHLLNIINNAHNRLGDTNELISEQMEKYISEELVNKQTEWLKSNSPIVYVYGESDVSRDNLLKAKEGVEEVFREVNELNISINMQAKLFDEGKNIADSLFRSNYSIINDPKNASTNVTHYLNHIFAMRKMEPHLNIILTNREVYGPWGFAANNYCMITTRLPDIKTTVKHEFYHILGIRYSDSEGGYKGNCPTPNCLMNYAHSPNSKLCQNCVNKVLTNLR